MLYVERVKGIEPLYEAWEAVVLPLNYTRNKASRIIAELWRINNERALWP